MMGLGPFDGELSYRCACGSCSSSGPPTDGDTLSWSGPVGGPVDWVHRGSRCSPPEPGEWAPFGSVNLDEQVEKAAMALYVADQNSTPEHWTREGPYAVPEGVKARFRTLARAALAAVAES